MRAERLNLSIFAPKKLCGRRTVIAPKSRTTLILDRCAQCRGTDSVLRTSAHLLAAHPTATPKQAKDSSVEYY